MDLQLYSRVLWRWRKLVIAGMVAAVVLALLSVYRPTTSDSGVPTLTHRTSELWRSDATVYLTYPGFPGGRTTLTPDPLQFNRIAALYASLANSDAVRRRVLAGGVEGYYTAIPAADRTYGETTPLPMVSVLGHAPTADGARALTQRAAMGLVSYVRRQQKAAGIPERQRVAIELLNAPNTPVNIEPRKKTLPIVVFLAVLIGTIALAFVLENARPVRLADRERLEPAPEPNEPDFVLAETSAAPILERVEPAPKPDGAKLSPEAVPVTSVVERVEPVPEPDEPEFPEDAPVTSVRRWA